MKLDTIPVEILTYIITEYLSVQDTLSLKQTCRALHAVGSTAFIWNNFLKRLIWDYEHPIEDLDNNSSDVLQRMVVRALKTEINWSSPSPHFYRIQKLEPMTASLESPVECVHIVNRGRALLTLQVHRNLTRVPMDSSIFTLWDVSSSSGCVKLWSYEIVGRSLFNAVYESATYGVMASAVHTNKEGRSYVHVCEFDFSANGSRRQYGPLVMDRLEVSVDRVSVRDGIVGAIIVHPNGQEHHRILIWNYKTDHSTIISLETSFQQSMWVADLRLRAEDFVFYCADDKHISICLYSLPSNWTVSTPSDSIRYISQFTIPGAGVWPTIQMTDTQRATSHSSTSPTEPLYFLEFSPIASADVPRSVEEITFQLGAFEKECLESASTMKPYPSVLWLVRQVIPHLAHHICFGSSGLRAVWLDAYADNHELMNDYRIIRLSANASRKGLRITEVPSEGLPFRTREIHNIAFQDVVAKLVICLVNGEVWMLDFGPAEDIRTA